MEMFFWENKLVTQTFKNKRRSPKKYKACSSCSEHGTEVSPNCLTSLLYIPLPSPNLGVHLRALIPMEGSLKNTNPYFIIFHKYLRFYYWKHRRQSNEQGKVLALIVFILNWTLKCEKAIAWQVFLKESLVDRELKLWTERIKSNLHP